MTPHAAIKKAIRVAGTQNRLAELLGVSQSAVAHWASRDLQIGATQALNCHLKLGGAVSVHQLRPDLYPAELITVKDFSKN